MARVMLVEDDASIRNSLTRALEDLGHAVATASQGMRALETLIASEPDVVLLDLGLPDVDGLKVLGMLRAISEVPVIVITARDDEGTIVAALDAGADDYVQKPFGMDQIAARIRAILRRAPQQQQSETERTITIGGLEIDPSSRSVRLDGAPITLSRKEFDLLLVLAQRPGEVITKRELLSEVWQQAYGGGDRTVDVHVSWLRRKLGETAAEPRYLHTVRGVGIKLSAPDL